MNNESIIAIGSVVGALSKFLQMTTFIKGPWIVLVSMLTTTLVFSIWGYSHGDFARDTTWDYFTAWVTTLGLSAAGYHGTEEAVKKVVEVSNRG
jgi:hypothetical protein